MPSLATLEGYINTALNSITGIKSVTTDIAVFSKPNSYPVEYYSLNRSASSYISFPHATNADMEGIAELRIYGSVKPRYKSNIKSDTYTLIANTEKAIYSSTNLQANCVSCLLRTEENDMDINEAYGYFEMTFEIVYLYNHLAP